MIPDCTIVTSFYKCTQDSCIQKIDLLLQLPVYIVLFTEKEFVEIFKSKRKDYGFSDITLIIERKFENLLKYKYLENFNNNCENNISSESHLLLCSKFDFVLDTIKFNPFNTNNFSWVDAFICEKYSQDKLLNIFNNITEKFHIQIPNVINKSFKLSIKS